MGQGRDRRPGIAPQTERRSRQHLARPAHPQPGVDASAGVFPTAAPELPEGARRRPTGRRSR